MKQNLQVLVVFMEHLFLIVYLLVNVALSKYQTINHSVSPINQLAVTKKINSNRHGSLWQQCSNKVVSRPIVNLKLILKQENDRCETLFVIYLSKNTRQNYYSFVMRRKRPLYACLFYCFGYFRVLRLTDHLHPKEKQRQKILTVIIFL